MSDPVLKGLAWKWYREGYYDAADAFVGTGKARSPERLAQEDERLRERFEREWATNGDTDSSLGVYDWPVVETPRRWTLTLDDLVAFAQRGWHYPLENDEQTREQIVAAVDELTPIPTEEGDNA